jgi:hypothetical protein
MANITILPSRFYPSAEDFVDDFLKTLTPGIIDRSQFIDWHFIESKLKEFTEALEFYKELAYRFKNGADFIKELADSCLAHDDPLILIKCAFELLGHTDNSFVTLQDDIDILKLAREIANGNENTAFYFARTLKDLGFKKLLLREDIEDIFLGVQIGLETHRRKNLGGTIFQTMIKKLINEIINHLKVYGYDVDYKEEVTINYGKGLRKKLDFLILYRGAPRFGIEVNFYTVPGSKPTEIKRSYRNILEGLSKQGIDLIWITDGKGYTQMKKSLKDAYSLLPNIYNLKQVEAYLLADIKAIFDNEKQ